MWLPGQEVTGRPEQMPRSPICLVPGSAWEGTFNLLEDELQQPLDVLFCLSRWASCLGALAAVVYLASQHTPRS